MKRILSCILVMVLLLSFAGCGGSKCTSIVLSDSEVSLSQPGQTKGLTVTKNPENAKDKVNFKSNNSSVALVDEYGLITAVGEGSATITVTCGDAVAFCEVVVGEGITVDEDGCAVCGASGKCPYCGGEPYCAECGGKGKVQCPTCKGDPDCNKCVNGICSSCGGDYYDEDHAKCGVCLGDGKCTGCNGEGRRNSRKCSLCDGNGECRICNGTGLPKYGVAVCPACVKGKCKNCEGTGIICSNCSDGFVKCNTCSGEERICPECEDGKCPACHGEGVRKSPNPSPTQSTEKVKCSTCQDSGWCPHCNGLDVCSNENCILGTESCTSCYGTGDCEVCYGLGTVGDRDCSSCTGGNCRKCGGKGKWQCGTCGGTGECNYCDGGLCPTCGG